jgi:hypothetical protein
MTTDERLTLAIRAQVAAIRADQAGDRAALLERRAAALLRAWEQFEALFGRRPSLDDSTDRAALGRILRTSGAGDVPWTVVREAAAALREVGRLRQQAGDAMRALHDAWRGREDDTLLSWVGVDEATFERAVRVALAGPDTDTGERDDRHPLDAERLMEGFEETTIVQSVDPDSDLGRAMARARAAGIAEDPDDFDEGSMMPTRIG